MTGGWAAIVLAGGRAERMAGAEKILAEVGGAPVLARVLAACAGARVVVVVGPPELAAVVGEAGLLVREDPPFDGPVAACRAGLAALDHGSATPGHRRIALLAGDQPRLSAAALAALDAALDAGGADAAVLLDTTGHQQFLCALWDAGALRDALAAAGSSMRSLFAAARVRTVPDSWGASADIDTPADLRRARADFA